MRMDSDCLKPYLDAVKRARSARQMIAIKVLKNQALQDELVRADAAYVQAYTELAEFTESCTET
ncbi:hypothetical protein SAMN04488483_5358 [Pseudomonas helmanticensis]|uniref:Uncharacterized protein n=1 Tax=Pseudomonas helmanticensis TaxID=1471381 RepID=A0ACD2UDD1_9PSED|nr:hypothetical protein [Pseudomonas helmanticensis]SMQ30360.1 hypothetical protein SAMN04488483_5358 [Pseudomonas helmanticensis]